MLWEAAEQQPFHGKIMYTMQSSFSRLRWPQCVVVCLALVVLASCSRSDSICEVSSASGDKTVEIHPKSQQEIELHSRVGDTTQIISTLIGQLESVWFVAQISENEAETVYGWISRLNPEKQQAAKSTQIESQQYPQWLTATNRVLIEPTLCRNGQQTFSVVISDEPVILVGETRETVLEPPADMINLGSIPMPE